MKAKQISFRKFVLIAAALRLALIFTLPHPDVLNHVDWGVRFWQYGPRDFYEQIFWGFSWPNQPIGSILLFAAIAKIKEALFGFLWFLNLKIASFPSFIFPYLEKNLHFILLKIPFVLSDLGLGLLIYKIARDLFKKEKLALLASALFLFNPALIYNSTVWGQTDSLINFLAILGLWLFWQKKFFRGWFFYLSSLYFKLSLIIFAPLFVLMIYKKRSRIETVNPISDRAKDVLRPLVSLLMAISIFLLISLPFVHHGNVFTWFWYLYTNRVLPRQGNMLSGNAFNLWSLFCGVDLSFKENLLVWGLAAKTWGRGLFLLLTGGGTLLLALKKKKLVFVNYLRLGLIYAFAAFLFLTNMHERYLYPVFPLLAILAVRERRLLWPFVLFSLIHLVNLYHLWWYPRWEPIVIFLTLFNGLFPRLFSLANLGLFLLILRWFLKDEKILA